jgi:hypothetical protein
MVTFWMIKNVSLEDLPPVNAKKAKNTGVMNHGMMP